MFMNRVWRIVLWLVIAFAVLMAGFLAWLWWPYPTVTSIPGTTLSNEPVDGAYQTGDVVRWTTTRVCQPPGLTKVTVSARLAFPAGSSETPVVEREFWIDAEEDLCIDNNPTSLWLPGSLPSGTYRVEVRACVPNPTPRDKCATFEGPEFTMERIALTEGATL